MRSARAIVATWVALALVACGSGSDDSTITVFAAASLTDAFEEIADAFEDGEPGVSVRLNLAGSSSLREQVLQGAPADVVATANPSVMDELVDAGAVDRAEQFAANSLQIVVPRGNPAGVADLDDFADADLLIGLCAAEVPCGEFARRVLALAGVEPALDTNEPDVRALLTKVEAGELDAAIERAQGGQGEDYKEIVYEGYGPHGVPMMVVTTTDNPTRTIANVRMHFKKGNGNIGTSGSVSFMFQRMGVFRLKPDGVEAEELELEMIDHGLEELLDGEDDEVE